MAPGPAKLQKRPARTAPRAYVVPVLPPSCSRAEFVRVYRRSNVVVLRAAAETSSAATSAVLEALQGAHAAQPRVIDATFTLENAGGKASSKASGKVVVAARDPAAVLAASPSGRERWYASFIWQGAATELSAVLSATLPCAVPRALAAEPAAAEPTQPTWFFIGFNPSLVPLPGRPEHTDELSHDGTWHFQLSGRKLWRLRPTDELLNSTRCALGPAEVMCAPGDVILINTRLWWHSTELPPSEGGRTRGTSPALSISYARDFRLRGLAAGGAAGGSDGSDAGDMTNVDGLFATEAIRKGTAILTADEMPDVELPVSADPNCEVREDARTGQLVLVAKRNIASGTFFTIPADSDEEDNGGGEGEDERTCRPCM
ncbi:hypothetical protein T492DRAFT_1024066 [Pavlovales sp. CCMP2436]|nr:hypothetical protein T492DRAFT_1024066 [Pavlovales sp. CCMP2436]